MNSIISFKRDFIVEMTAYLKTLPADATRDRLVTTLETATTAVERPVRRTLQKNGTVRQTAPANRTAVKEKRQKELNLPTGTTIYRKVGERTYEAIWNQTTQQLRWNGKDYTSLSTFAVATADAHFNDGKPRRVNGWTVCYIMEDNKRVFLNKLTGTTPEEIQQIPAPAPAPAPEESDGEESDSESESSDSESESDSESDASSISSESSSESEAEDEEAEEEAERQREEQAERHAEEAEAEVEAEAEAEPEPEPEAPATRTWTTWSDFQADWKAHKKTTGPAQWLNKQMRIAGANRTEMEQKAIAKYSSELNQAMDLLAPI